MAAAAMQSLLGRSSAAHQSLMLAARAPLGAAAHAALRRALGAAAAPSGAVIEGGRFTKIQIDAGVPPCAGLDAADGACPPMRLCPCMCA